MMTIYSLVLPTLAFLKLTSYHEALEQVQYRQLDLFLLFSCSNQLAGPQDDQDE